MPISHRLLVFLAFLDRRMRGVDVFERREALHAHPLEVAVGHRMAHERHLQSRVEQGPADLAAGLRLAAAGACRADGDDGLRRVQHRRVRPHQSEVGAGREHDRRLVHHRLVLEVGVAEDDLVDVVPVDELRQLLLGPNRYPVRVPPSGERGRIDAIGDSGDLRRREGDDVGVRVVAEGDIEVVEVPPAGSHDDDLAH